jgi:hypothetical protein
VPHLVSALQQLGGKYDPVAQRGPLGADIHLAQFGGDGGYAECVVGGGVTGCTGGGKSDTEHQRHRCHDCAENA